MCRVYRCDRVYQWRQVLGVITVITQWYPMITNTSSASPWIPWPFPQPGLDVAPKGVACTPPGRAVSGCVRLCLSPTLCSSLADGCDLGSVMGKNRGVYLPTSTTSTSLTYCCKNWAPHTFPFGIQIAQPTVLPLSCILLHPFTHSRDFTSLCFFPCPGTAGQ